jgi:hypothetical protein
MNVGEFFKYLNSDACRSFYADLTSDNKDDILETMMNDTDFMTTVQEWMPDPAMLRSKIDTNLGQVLKKRSKPETKKEVVPEPAKPVKHVSDDDEDDFMVFDDDSDDKKEDEIISCIRRSDRASDSPLEDYPDYDEEKGKYIGNGYYLKHEGHLMKMTSPEWIVYY